MQKMTDKLIPEPGEQLTVQKVRPGHVSEKIHQDSLEEIMLRNLKNATPGTARRKHQELDYYAWVQNGRPVYGQPKGKSRDGHGGTEELYYHDKHPDERKAPHDIRGELTKRLKKLIPIVKAL